MDTRVRTEAEGEVTHCCGGGTVGQERSFALQLRERVVKIIFKENHTFKIKKIIHFSRTLKRFP